MIHDAEPTRIKLAQLPTPLVLLENLSKHLELPVVPLMKRDDMSGLEGSGNKIRKLEYVVADALAQGADVLVTHGGYQSNHCRATAAIAARLGLGCRLLLRAPAEAGNDGNLFLDRLFGAEISLHLPEVMANDKNALIEEAMNDLKRKGKKPYFFPVGASVPLGCWGYIRGFCELLDQFGANGMMDVFVPVSSSGTLAGMILGSALFKPHDHRVIGIPVSDSLEFFQQDVRRLMNETISKYALNLTAEQTPVELLDGCIGEGYSIPSDEGMAMLKLLGRTQGIAIDPTYTSKALAGFVKAIQDGTVRQGATPIFVHTGGIFGLFARRDLFSTI